MTVKKLTIFCLLNVSLLFAIGQTDTLQDPHFSCTLTLDFPRHSYDTKNNYYGRPVPWGFVRNIPDNLWQLAKVPFRKKYLAGLSVVAGTSAILIWQDQHISDEVKHFSKKIHLHSETDYKVLLRIGDTKILKIPQNINTAFYQVGEGATGMFIAGCLYIIGKINHDNRALQTASDLTESFISMGLVTQIIKRSTGRQSPFMATRRGGLWRPFPSFSDYQANTPGYDAFPSGHLASMMATVIVLAENYPEKKWIKPVGYSLMGLSCFAMINTDVHWAGDYPLALALGYISGKITTHRHKKKIILNPGF